MSGFRGKFASIRNDWTTPEALYREMDAEFGFTLDAAASAENAKAPAFFDKEMDAITRDWRAAHGLAESAIWRGLSAL